MTYNIPFGKKKLMLQNQIHILTIKYIKLRQHGAIVYYLYLPMFT